MGVIDPNAMYRAGYSSKARGKSGKAHLADTIDKVLGLVGRQVINKWSAGMGELSELRKKSRRTKSDINTLVNDVGAEMNADFKNNLAVWNKEYDKGAKMASYGLTAKRRAKGEAMMDYSYGKMQNMHTKFQDLSAKVAKYEKQGLLYQGEDVADYDGPGWGAGMDDDEFLNASQLANGKLFKHMTVDPDTGDISIMREKQNDDGTITLWNEPLEDLDWPEDADNTLQGVQKGYIESSVGNGDKGKPWDEMHDKYMLDEITGSVNSASQAAVKDYFFGGTANDFSDGKMESSSPAHIMLLEQGFEPNTEQWEGQLKIMKNEMDFSKDGMARKKITDLMHSAAKKYHENAYGLYEEKQLQKRREKGSNKGSNIDKDEFKFAGAYTPPSDKYEDGTWVTPSEQRRMNISVRNKKQRIPGADGYYYVLTGDKKNYMMFDSKKQYDELNKKKGALVGKDMGTVVDFQTVLDNNAAGTGTPSFG
jgi:hypothetical protein